MALSGSVNWSLTASQLIEASFALIGVKKMEQPLVAAELQDGINTLNLMLKAWQAQGLHLWTEEEGILFLVPGQTDYLLGPSGDECTKLDDFIGTTILADEAAAQTVLSLTSTTGMVAADFIGIELDDGTRQWTTIVSVDSATQVTVTVALTGAAAAGNSVFTYTSLVTRPLRILSFRRKVYDEDNEIMVESWSRDQYFNQTNKTSQGTVVNAYYSPQLTNGRVYVWQTASTVNDLLRFTYEEPIQDIDASTNDLDIPVEWLECVQYNLASRLSDTYDVPMEKASSIGMKAQMFLDNLLGFDQEITSINVSPMRMY